MSNYVFVDPYIGVVPMSGTATSAQFEVGMQVRARNAGDGPNTGSSQSVSVGPTVGGGVFQYAQGYTASAPQSAGQLCFLLAGSAQAAVSGNTANRGPMGFAAGAISASNVYGWVQVQGYCDYARGHTAGDMSKLHRVHIATTLGCFETTASAASFVVQNAWVASNGSSVGNSTNQTVYLHYPFYEHAI